MAMGRQTTRPRLATAGPVCNARTRLPQELCDQIIQNLSDDPRALSLCCTACKAWVPTVRWIRFERTCLKPKNLLSFRELLAVVPIVTTYMHHLTIDFTWDPLLYWWTATYYEPAVWFVRHREALYDVATGLENVTALKLLCFPVSSSALSRLSPLFQKVTELNIANIISPSTDELVNFIHAFPALHALSIDGRVVVHPEGKSVDEIASTRGRETGSPAANVRAGQRWTLRSLFSRWSPHTSMIPESMASSIDFYYDVVFSSFDRRTHVNPPLMSVFARAKDRGLAAVLEAASGVSVTGISTDILRLTQEALVLDIRGMGLMPPLYELEGSLGPEAQFWQAITQLMERGAFQAIEAIILGVSIVDDSGIQMGVWLQTISSMILAGQFPCLQRIHCRLYKDDFSHFSDYDPTCSRVRAHLGHVDRNNPNLLYFERAPAGTPSVLLG